MFKRRPRPTNDEVWAGFSEIATTGDPVKWCVKVNRKASRSQAMLSWSNWSGTSASTPGREFVREYRSLSIEDRDTVQVKMVGAVQWFQFWIDCCGTAAIPFLLGLTALVYSLAAELVKLMLLAVLLYLLLYMYFRQLGSIAQTASEAMAALNEARIDVVDYEKRQQMGEIPVQPQPIDAKEIEKENS